MHFKRAMLGAHVIVKDFGPAAGDRIESRIAQALDRVFDGEVAVFGDARTSLAEKQCR